MSDNAGDDAKNGQPVKDAGIPVAVTEDHVKTFALTENRRWALAFVVCISVGIGAGALSAKYFVDHAPSRPQTPQVMILDSGRITQDALKSNPNDPKKAVEESIRSIKARISQLTSIGIIVIDRSAVIDAPDGAFINVDSSK